VLVILLVIDLPAITDYEHEHEHEEDMLAPPA
jgi:hypothetical protein